MVHTELGPIQRSSIRGLCTTPDAFIGVVTGSSERMARTFGHPWFTDITLTVERDLTDTFPTSTTVTVRGVWRKGASTSSAGYLLPVPVDGRRYLIALDRERPTNNIGETVFWAAIELDPERELPDLHGPKAWTASATYRALCPTVATR